MTDKASRGSRAAYSEKPSARFRAHFGSLAILISVGAALGPGKPVMAASPPGDVVGKVSVGYQGWFACNSDGSPINAWWHWTPNSQTPSSNNIGIYCWPDMRQYARGFQTAFTNLGNGQPATLFSSYDQQVVDTHFRWMEENEIDTAALQRFSPFGGEGPTRNGMTLKVRSAAETYNRKFYIMYDISGWNSFATEIKMDWTNYMIAQINITNSPAYAMQNGKPVVCIWGMGFTDRPGDEATCTEVINWFKDQGCYVIGGVPTWWRDSISDSKTNFLSVYTNFHMISPWMVGRFNDAAGSDSYRSSVNQGDISFCNGRGIDYQPCIVPGHRWQTPPSGGRMHGDYMWRQIVNMMQIGSHGLYISMYDEFNEATQLIPTAEDASMNPVGSSFITWDADGVPCSADFYLRLMRDAGRMFKGQIPFQITHSTPFVLPPVIPPAPTNLVAESGNSQVRLTWAASAQAASYSVRRATVSGGPYTTVATNVGFVSYTDTGLVNDTIYYYVVRAVNSLGESLDSAEVLAAPVLLGLKGDYYNNVDLTGFVLSRVDPGMNFNWGNGSPDPSIGADTFSVRWTGQVQPLFSQTYTFYTLSDDGVRLWVNGVQLVNNWTGHAPTENSGTIALTAGTRYSIQMDYYEDGGGAVAGLSWSSSSQPKEIIPANRLFPPFPPSAPTGLTATTKSSSQIKLSWFPNSGATGYNVKRATASGGPYTTVAPNVASLAYTNNGLANGTIYYFVVSATNSFGESSNSIQASAQTVSTTPPQLGFGINSGSMQFTWPSDHLGWRLEMQTNSIGAGLGTNWVTVSGSAVTNQVFVPVGPENGSVFFRLVYP
jgi:PA14 domain/Fibronectin type III domain